MKLITSRKVTYTSSVPVSKEAPNRHLVVIEREHDDDEAEQIERHALRTQVVRTGTIQPKQLQ